MTTTLSLPLRIAARHSETLDWLEIDFAQGIICDWPRRIPVPAPGSCLCPSEAAALALPGELRRHYKGGLYRIVATLPYRGVLHVVYEHLFPHEHAFWARPAEMFHGTQGDGTPRFARLVV